MTMARVLSAVNAPLMAWYERTKDLPAVQKRRRREPARIAKARTTSQGSVARPIFRITCKDTNMPDMAERQQWHEIAMNILSEMLFCRAAAFYDSLFEAGHISPTYSYGHSAMGGPTPVAYHYIEGEADDPELVYAAYFDYLARLRQTGLEHADFERMRRVLYAGFVSQFDFPDDIADLLCDTFAEGRGLFDALDVLQHITFEDIEALFECSLDLESTVLTVITPNPKQGGLK
jgi:hypothetical protein